MTLVTDDGNFPSVATEDGGAHAIRGFLYQFDVTLLEMLEQPTRTKRFEQTSDIDDDDSYTQVKCYPSCDYALSRIAGATRKLFDSFTLDASRSPRLYCHFRNTAPGGSVTISTIDLDKVLRSDAVSFSSAEKAAFVSRFKICFREDYIAQFKRLCVQLRERLKVSSPGLECIYHGMLRNQLLEMVRGPKERREASFDQLCEGIRRVRANISMDGYQDYLNAEQYFKFVRREFIMPRLYRGTAATSSRRLFVVEAHADEAEHEITHIAEAIINTVPCTAKTSIHGAIPLLYVRGIGAAHYMAFKKNLLRSLARNKFVFLDGTSTTDLELQVQIVTSNLEHARPRLSLVDENVVKAPTFLMSVEEIFQFFVRTPLELPVANRLHVRIQVESTTQVLRMLEKSSRG